MNTLINLISDTLSIAYIEENEAVMDGTFTVVPYLTDGLAGDGKPQTVVDYYAVELFYESKSTAVSSARTMWLKLIEKKYFCDNPQYTYEKDAQFWRVTLRVKLLSTVEV